MFLKQHNIAHEELDVAANKEAREEMVRKSGQMAVPVIEIDGDILVGYDEGKLKEKLGR